MRGPDSMVVGGTFQLEGWEFATEEARLSAGLFCC